MLIAAAAVSQRGTAQTQTANAPIESGFVGSPGCSTSLCHGGADEKNNHYTLWRRNDVHVRSQVTLTTARSARIAETLKAGDATRSDRCVSCHAPFSGLPEGNLAGIKRPEPVSCETCHGPAESWLRSHTRIDYSYHDRVHAGLRDLRNLYVRANSCVACHERLDADLITAGHPELIFELDGQTSTQPRHWREQGEYHGPQAWLTGQAAALRELSWQLARGENVNDDVAARWRALVWLLRKVENWEGQGSFLKEIPARPSPEVYDQVRQAADDLAKAAASAGWSGARTESCLRTLGGSAEDFLDRTIPAAQQARRAERLALALDRLVLPLDEERRKQLEPEMKELFALIQSRPDFNPAAFSQTLARFAGKL